MQPFMPPAPVPQITHPTEFYKDNVYRVIHSTEEAAKAIKDGWGLDRDPGQTYIPITAVVPVRQADIAPAASRLRAEQQSRGAALDAEAAKKQAAKEAAQK